MHYETERHRDSTDGLNIFRSMFLAEPFRTLHECSDSVSAHSCLQLAVAMEIVRMQMSCIQNTKSRSFSPIKRHLPQCTEWDSFM